MALVRYILHLNKRSVPQYQNKNIQKVIMWVTHLYLRTVKLCNVQGFISYYFNTNSVPNADGIFFWQNTKTYISWNISCNFINKIHYTIHNIHSLQLSNNIGEKDCSVKYSEKGTGTQQCLWSFASSGLSYQTSHLIPPFMKSHKRKSSRVRFRDPDVQVLYLHEQSLHKEVGLHLVVCKIW
jgi:hypothetical protein